MDVFIQFLPMVAVLVIFYALLIIPDRKRKKKYQEMITKLKVNDEVQTRGGIIGRIVNLKDDYIILESGPDRARLKITKDGILTVLSQKIEEK